MDQKTGIRSLFAEFFRGYGAEIRLICPRFRPNSTYKQNSAPTFWSHYGCGGRGSGATRNQGETAAFSYLNLNSAR
jgi:hypothetical protein